MIFLEEKDPRFFIAASTIKDAGLGLFAKTSIKKGSFIEIIGIMVERGSVADQCTAYANKYKFGASEEDKLIIPMGYAGLVNHAPDKKQQNCEIRHTRAKIPTKKRKEMKDFFYYAGEAVYLFIRDVEKDEEILGHYGHEWNVHQDWLSNYNRIYEENEIQWKKFLSHGLYNCDLLRDKISIEEDNLRIIKPGF
jgi:hypothetical protein